MKLHGKPTIVKSDNSPEFVAKKVQDWIEERPIGARFIEPGSPWQNGHNESFNAVFRDGLLESLAIRIRPGGARSLGELASRVQPRATPWVARRAGALPVLRTGKTPNLGSGLMVRSRSLTQRLVLVSWACQSNPTFYRFSDKPEWVRENLGFSEPARLADQSGPNAGSEDLRLMSWCAHRIIANSTFSWWGAWLNPNPDKIVVAPKQWFADESLDTSDLLPTSGVKL